MHDPNFYPGWLRTAHLINIVFISFLLRSGLQILSAFPRLYWTDNCRPGIERVKFTNTQVPREDPDTLYAAQNDTEDEGEPVPARPGLPRRITLFSMAGWGLRRLVHAARLSAGKRKEEAPAGPPRIYTSLEEEKDISPWLALPGHKNLGLGRHWHFFSDIIWILNGLVFVVLLCTSSDWRYLVPTSWSIIPNAAHSAWTYLHLRLPPDLPGQPFDALQKLAYFFITFILAPFQIATGAAMSPALAARFPWYIKLFGGRQKARSFHFLSLIIFIGFVIVHTCMVIIHGFSKELAEIMWGRPEFPTLTIIFAILVGIGLVLLQVAATKLSLDHPRAVQAALGKVVHAATTLAFGWEGSREEYPPSEISPYFWINGHPPVDTSYQAMVRKHFVDWRLEVNGLVKQPLRLSLEDLRALPKVTQITKHNCIQGWSDVGEWGGVQLCHIMELCQPLPTARYVVFHALDDKATSERDAPAGGYFYGTLNLRWARHHQTILAYEMNGRPLPIPRGAPLRLRVETQLGFKMVKWLRKIEFIEDYRTIGRGMGGWREDNQYYDTQAGIEELKEAEE